MPRSFRRNLREEFKNGDLGPLEAYKNMQFSNLVEARESIILGALEYINYKSAFDQQPLPHAVIDITTVFTEEFPITALKANRRDGRVMMGRDGDAQQYASVWNELLREKGMKGSYGGAGLSFCFFKYFS